MSTSLKLQIPEPCHENWNAMTPKEQGRHCTSCNKIVVDFSVMTDRQVLDFFSNYSGNTCGRFAGDQLNRVIDPKVRHAKGWLRYALAVFLPAMFLGAKTYAQGRVAAPKTPVKIASLAPDTKDSSMNIAPAVEKEVSINLQEFELVGIAGGISVQVEIEEPTLFHQFKRFVTDSLRGESFKLSPNPVKAGAALNISYKLAKGGYIIQVIDAQGRLMQQQVVKLNNDVNTLAIRLNAQYAGGQYLLLLADDKRRKIMSKQFIIR